MKKISTGLFFLYSLLFSAQKDHDAVLSDITSKVKEYYVDKDTYKKVDSFFQSQIKSGALNEISKKDLAVFLTENLKTTTKDKHFFVKYIENYTVERQGNEKKIQQLYNFHNSLENYGFENVQRLEGNIGYINFKGFAESSSSSKTLAAAMNFVANTNSLIIDLRENHGGDNEMLLLFCSYFFNKKTDLYTTYFRKKKITEQNSTQTKVSGQKYLHKKIYILTSERTFSAGEGLAYFLQQYKLAEVIGEITGGAANPVDHFVIQNQYLLFVPAGKITSALTQSNWDHKGVIPDEQTKAENALKIAHIKALKNILKTNAKTELNIPQIKDLIGKLEQ